MEEKKVYTKEEVLEKSIEYFNGDLLAAEVWTRKYALKDSFENYYELTPDDMHRRIASEIARVEKNYPNPLSEDEIFEVLKDFKYIIPAGGSMTGVGNNLQVASLSNCFVIGEKGNSDSYGGILKIDQEQVQLMKRRGGVGHDLSHIRPEGSPVKNSALTSTGIVPFMERYSNSTREVAQCIAKGEKVLTKNGLKCIEDIKIGESVWTKIGWIKVEDVFKNGKKQIFKTTTSRGHSIRTSEDHIFLDEDLKEKRIKDFKLGEKIMLIPGKREFEDLIADDLISFFKDGVEETYDLKLEKEHLFYCEGFYVHNSGRRGALMLSVSIKHPDAEKFIDAKMEDGKITGANVSVKLHDDFMKAALGNKLYTQQFPVDSDNPKIKKEIDASALWKKIIHNAWKSAEPGVLFWSKIIEESVSDCYADMGFKTLSVNPCGEIILPSGGACMLQSINLFSYVINPFSKKAKFNFNLFKKHVRIAQKMMDDLLDLELEKVDNILRKIDKDPEDKIVKQIEKNLWINIQKNFLKTRRTGLGITAEGDMIAAMNLTYGTKEATEFSVNVHKILKLEAYHSSVEMAKQRGAFEIWDAKREVDNPFLNRIKKEDRGLYDDMMKYGRRNIALLTVAPTGCLGENEKIKTDRGTISMRELFEINGVDIEDLTYKRNIWFDIEDGIEVCDINGEYNKIKKLYWNGMTDGYKLIFDDGHQTITSKPHRFLVLKDKDKAVWKSSEQLKIGDKIVKLE